jgi:hypothetical protein
LQHSIEGFAELELILPSPSLLFVISLADPVDDKIENEDVVVGVNGSDTESDEGETTTSFLV